MRVAVTGATGFVGSSLIKALKKEGHDIVALARPSSDHRRLEGVMVDWVEADILQRDALGQAFDGADWVIHAAGMLGRAGVAELEYQTLHVQGTLNVLDAAEAARISRLLYISSPGVLGPITGDPVDENSPLAPSNAYERSKAAAEKTVLDRVSAGSPVVVTRPEFIYGPGDMHVLGLFRAVKRGVFFYVDGGRHMCHPTYVDDAVQGMQLCLENGRMGEIYHIAGPRPVSFRELGETIADALDVRRPRLSLPNGAAKFGASALEALSGLAGKEPPISRAGIAFFSEDRAFSWEKAHDELGYRPQVTLKQGVQQSVDWYRLNKLV